ncbi:MAG: CubicO group peptidase (beta-lactamase class C family) [Gammaproteobacteria bacterium]|jgi:CubicO group peptidase (beta-lactamase class C family)
MKKIVALLIFFTCCYVSGMTFATEQDLTLSRLKLDLYRIRDEFNIPAMAVIIVDQNNILMADVNGLADRASNRPATPQTVFRIGSITKMFTSLAILLLQEEGLLNLEMNVHELTPSIPVKNKWRDTHPIKVSHLLEHTAGLRGLSKVEFDHNTSMTLERALQWKADDRYTYWPPGLHHSYTNVGPGLAQYIIEKVSKQSFESFIDKRIFSPLKMSSTSLDNDEITQSQLATGYDTDGYSVIPYWHMLYRGFGAINLRPTDMVPFLQLLMNKGKHKNQRFLTEASIERMETPSTSLAALSGLQFGYGLGNYTWLRNGLLFHGHGGDADGYLSRLAYNRDNNLGYFIAINTFNNNALLKIRHKIEDFIGKNHEVFEPPLYPLSEEKLRLFTGVYKAVTERFSDSKLHKNEVIVSTKDGNLLLYSNNSIKTLYPVNTRHFRYQGESGATSAFVMDAQEQIYLQNSDGNFKKISK